MWQLIPVIPETRQEYLEFEASLRYIVRLGVGRGGRQIGSRKGKRQEGMDGERNKGRRESHSPAHKPSL